MTMNSEELFAQTLSILIVDDDAEARAETQTALARFGIGSDSYGNVEKAMDMIRLHHARRQDYDLILADHDLTETNGADLIHEIRNLLGETATVIFLTVKDDNIEKAAADAVLAKPLSVENILQAYRQAASRKQREQANLSIAELEGRRILVAEDMTVNAEIVKQLLSMNFMEVDHAKNGKEAVTLFTKSPKDYYDAILMDVRMPVMDGLKATEAIRASEHPNAKTVPIIALTTNYFDEDVARSLEAGMDAHLEKPVEPKQIYRTLAELIGKQK